MSVARRWSVTPSRVPARQGRAQRSAARARRRRPGAGWPARRWYGYDWWTTGRFIETTDDAYVGGNVTAIAPHVARLRAAHPGRATTSACTPANCWCSSIRATSRPRSTSAQAVVAQRAAALASLQREIRPAAVDHPQQAAADLAAKIGAGGVRRSGRRSATRALAQTAAGSRQDAQQHLRRRPGGPRGRRLVARRRWRRRASS